MNIDWSKAPEGATHGRDGVPSWYKLAGDKLYYWCDTDGHWFSSRYNIATLPAPFTPRPPEPKPYTRDEALQFLVERLDSWPTDIADAPLCPGWGWGVTAGDKTVFSNTKCGEIDSRNAVLEPQWYAAHSDFVPFISVEDAQPAPDMVNHPPHYQSDNGIECIDAIRAALGRDGFVSYCVGNSMKYLWRDKTDRVEDLRKAAWYLDRAI